MSLSINGLQTQAMWCCQSSKGSRARGFPPRAPLSNSNVRGTERWALLSAISKHGYGGAMNDLRTIAAQEQYVTLAMSSGFGHFAKSALGIAFRFASVSMMLGRTEFTRTPVPLRSSCKRIYHGNGRRLRSSISRGAAESDRSAAFRRDIYDRPRCL